MTGRLILLIVADGNDERGKLDGLDDQAIA
jgi:hypothetical protein